MTEPMLTMVEGQSRVAEAISIGARSRVNVKSPVTLTLSTRSHAFQGKVSNGPPQFAPALLTRICSASVRLRVSAASAEQRLGADTAKTSRASGHQRRASPDRKKLVCCDHGSHAAPVLRGTIAIWRQTPNLRLFARVRPALTRDSAPLRLSA